MSHMGNRIKKLRIQHKMTQDELAQQLGYSSRSSINKIEIGRSELPQSKITLAANILQTTPAYILGWQESIKPIDHEFEKFLSIHPYVVAMDGLQKIILLIIYQFLKRCFNLTNNILQTMLWVIL